jgi:hypothetical protein
MNEEIFLYTLGDKIEYYPNKTIKIILILILRCL